MLTERYLTKKNLVTFGFVTLFLHMAATLLPYFGFTQWPGIMDYICIGLLTFGAIIFAAKRQIPVRFQPAQTILAAFLIWYVFACLSMTITFGNDWVIYNREGLMYTAFSVLIAFPLGYTAVREEKNGIREGLLHALLMGWALFMLVVLINVFRGREIPLANGGVLCMRNGALWFSVSADTADLPRNTVGVLEAVFFMGSCYMLFRSSKIWMRAVYALALVIHYMGLVFANPGAGFYAVMAGFAVLTGLFAHIQAEKKDGGRSLLIAIAAGLAAGAVFCLLRTPVYRLAAGAGEAGQALHEKTRIWKFTIDGVFTSFRMFMFGVTPPSIPEMISQVSQGEITGTYTHNQLLEITAGIGIPGLCLFVAWLVIVLRDAWKLVFIRKDRSLLLSVPVIILVLLAVNMTEATLTFCAHIGGSAFFLLCGILHGKTNEPVGPKKLSRQAVRNKTRKKT